MLWEQREIKNNLRGNGEERRKKKHRKSSTNNLIIVFISFYYYRAETERNLCDAREEQVRNKEHFLAVQAQRERTEFERVLKYEREREEEGSNGLIAYHY